MKESRVKKLAVLGLSVLTILVIGVSIAVAQEPAGDDLPVAPCANFIDEDGDGACDLMGTGVGGFGQAGQGFGPGGNGAQGANFVDEDNDGVCDLMGTGAGGFGRGGNGACGADFVDEDGDGICDLAGTGQGSGPRGQGGNGFRGGAGNGFGNGQGQGMMGRGAMGASATQ